MGRPLGANRINDFFMEQKSVSKLNEAYQMSGGKVLTPNGRNSNSFQAKSTFEQGTAKRGAYSFGSGSSGSSSSPFFGGRTGAVHNTAPRLHGTNYHINTRGTTAFTKSLGGAAIAKAGMTYTQAFAKYGPLGLGALLFLDIALADGGLEDGTIPEHLRTPGETQEVEPPLAQSFTGGQMVGTNYYVSLQVGYHSDGTPNYRQKTIKGAITGELDYLIFGRYGGQNEITAYRVQVGTSSGWHNTGELVYVPTGSSPPGRTVVKIANVRTAGGQPDTGGDPPLKSNGIKTVTTTNHSNVKVEKAPDAFPSGVRPPFPSEKTANPTPSSSFTKPKLAKSSVVKQAVVKTPEGNIETNNNLNTNNSDFPTPTKQPSKLEAPSPTPEPIPTPKPPKEKSIQEVEQPKEPEIPVIISDTQTRRADGTTQRIVLRMATPEEMEEYTRIANTARIRNQRAAEIYQDYQNFLDLGYSEFENREPSEFDKFAQEVKDKRAETRQSPFGEVDWYTIAPSRFDGTDDWKHPFGKPSEKSEEGPQKTTNRLPVPEPDRPEDPQLKPTPEPVKQTSTVDDPIKDKIDKLPTVDDIGIAIAGLDIIKQIAEKAGTANPLCQAEGLRPAIDRNERTTATAQVAILGQGRVTQTAVNTANATLGHPTWGLQAIVTNASYGLQRIQGFALTAWRVTKADKIMAGVSMALGVHNAMMLSNNLLSSISEATNITFEAFGIRDAEDEPINLGAAVKSKINAVLTNLLGEANYEALTVRIAKANRIYQTGINLLDTTYSLKAVTKSIALELELRSRSIFVLVPMRFLYPLSFCAGVCPNDIALISRGIPACIPFIFPRFLSA